MTISEIARLSGLSIHTLRYYEKEGLLNNISRDESGRRNYSQSDLDWLVWIQRLKSTGMSLEKIKAFALLKEKGDSSLGLRRAMLVEHALTLKEEIKRLERELGIVEYKIEAYAIKEKEILT